MGLRTTEHRIDVALAVMSFALLCMLHRGVALRSVQSTSVFSRNLFKNAGKSGEDASAGTSGVIQGRNGGPEGTDLPRVMHRTIGPDEIKAEVIVVGDIHGCYDEMVSLLERCGYRLGNREDRERYSVVLVGDLVNKGPRSMEVVRTARQEGFLAVRGNHDNFALAAATGVGRFSRKEGGGGAVPPPWVQQLSSDDVKWLGSLPYTLSFPSLGCIVVHAGLVPGVPLDSQDAEALSCMRNLVEIEGGGGYEPRTLANEGMAWAKGWKGPEHIFFGHDAKRGFQKEAFATGLDTGCVYGRSLTAIVLPGRRVVCVPAEAAWSEPVGGGGDKNNSQ